MRSRRGLLESNELADAAGVRISPAEFEQFRRLIHETAGIALQPTKHALVAGRLASRLRARGMTTFAQYRRLLDQPEEASELQQAIDLLTTNETYFFREPQHFEILADHAARARASGRAYRVLSAAASSGEEAYSIAMTLAEVQGQLPWEVVGLDVSTRVIARAIAGRYPFERTKLIPEPYLKKYCLRGVGTQVGMLQVDPALRRRVAFQHANLTHPPPKIGRFDVIFLRNVLIYFDAPTKQRVVENLLDLLAPDGRFFTGHSESLSGVTSRVVAMKPAVYRLAGR